MKKNKYLNSKLSVLILSMYCFVGSVESLQAMHVVEGKSGEQGHSGEHEGSNGTGHEKGEPGKPNKGQEANLNKPTGSKGSNPSTESQNLDNGKNTDGSNGKETESKSSFDLTKKPDTEQPAAKEENSSSKKNETEQPAPKAEKMSTEEMSQELLEDAKAIKDPNDVEAVKAIMDKIGKMDASVTPEVLNSLRTEEAKLSEAVDKNAEEIELLKIEYDNLVKQSSKWIQKDGKLIEPTLFQSWVESVRRLFDSGKRELKLEDAKKTYLTSKSNDIQSQQQAQAKKQQELESVQAVTGLLF